MSDTPRTDAQVDKAQYDARQWYDFARQLERELNTAKVALSGRTVSCSNCNELAAENEVMKKAIYEFCKEQEWACDEWKKQSHIAPLFKLAEQHFK